MDTFMYSRRLDLVFDHTYELKQAGCYEEALITAYTSAKTNHYRWATSVIRDMFQRADRSKLATADGGQPLPPGEYTIYRGVAGVGKHRRIRGLSWTTSLDVACWFATNRFGLSDPAVYLTRIQANESLWASADTDANSEHEVIVLPARIRRMKLSTDEMQARAQRYASIIHPNNPPLFQLAMSH